MVRISVDLTVRDLTEDFERAVFVIHGIDDRRNHRPIAIWGQRISSHRFNSLRGTKPAPKTPSQGGWAGALANQHK